MTEHTVTGRVPERVVDSLKWSMSAIPMPTGILSRRTHQQCLIRSLAEERHIWETRERIVKRHVIGVTLRCKFAQHAFNLRGQLP